MTTLTEDDIERTAHDLVVTLEQLPSWRRANRVVVGHDVERRPGNRSPFTSLTVWFKEPRSEQPEKIRGFRCHMFPVGT